MQNTSAKRIVWQLPDGTLRFTTPAAPIEEGESEATYLTRVAERTKAALPELASAVRMADITAEEHAEIKRQRAFFPKKNP